MRFRFSAREVASLPPHAPRCVLPWFGVIVILDLGGGWCADEWVFCSVLFLAYCSLFFFFFFWSHINSWKKSAPKTTRKRVLSSWPPKDTVNNLLCIFLDFYFSECLTAFFSKMNTYYAQFCDRGCLEKTTLCKCGIYFQQAENICDPTVNIWGCGFFKKEILHFVEELW